MHDFDFSSIVNQIAANLAPKQATVAVAESLTGGLIASEIVRIAGSSRWFLEGVVAYANAAKAKRLLIAPEVIEKNTAVSRIVAQEMATGMRVTAGADIAISTTGLAGPGADEYGRGAGLVYIAGACNIGVVTKRLTLCGSRTQIREQAAYSALLLLRALSALI